MQQLFPAEGETVPKLRFPEFRNAEDWDKKLLSDVCERFSSTILANTLVNEGNFKVYGASGYFQNVNFYKEEKTYIGIVKDGSGVGRSFICEGKSSVLSTLQIIKPKGQNNLIFIWKLIKKINFSKYVAGGAIPHIYFKDYSKENITTPLPDEQKKIADCLSSLDNLIT
ncbi:restriction endonuclease subunit S, partial [Methylococcaceae bacterium CS1]